MFDINQQFQNLKDTVTPFVNKVAEIRNNLGNSVGINNGSIGLFGLGLPSRSIDIQNNQQQGKTISNYFNPNEINNIIHAESSSNPQAKSNVGARGLMQIMPDTWDEINIMRKQQNLPTYNYNKSYNSNINREYGTMYLNQRIPQILEAKNIPVNQTTMLLYYGGGSHWINDYQKDPKNLTGLTPSATQYLKNAKLL